MARCTVCDHPKRDQINTFLVGGDRTKTAIAQEFALSNSAITRHTKKHLAEKIARVMMRHDGSAVGKAIKTDKDALTERFHERLELLWDYSASAVEKASKAVRTVADRETGELVAVGADLGVIAPLLAQAHKNQEHLGKACGVLVDSQPQQLAGGMNLSITVPVSIGARGAEHGRIRAEATSPALESPVIDVLPDSSK